jgi:hypothetical protein
MGSPSSLAAGIISLILVGPSLADPPTCTATQLTGNDATTGDHCGFVAVSGEWAIIGAPRHKHDIQAPADSGAAYLFQPDPLGTGDWAQAQEVFRPPTEAQFNEHFGRAGHRRHGRCRVGPQS